VLGRDGSVSLSVDDEPVVVEPHALSATAVIATIDGVRHNFQVAVSGDNRTVDVDSALGSSSYVVVPRFTDPSELVAAGSLVAPMPGSVVRVLVEQGAAVGKGDPLIVLEAMKMEHTVASPAEGIVSEVRVSAGQQVDAGAVLVVVDTGSDATEPGD
jgi:propionyl-CoA carboxylase alpha chain